MRGKCVNILLWSFIFNVHSALADDCKDQARDDLEVAYCAVKAAGQGGTLPSLSEFRRNPPKTQHLLLARPAKRAGVTLPKLPSVPKKQIAESSLPKAEPQLKPEVKKTSARNLSKALSTCQVRAQTIVCGQRLFQLLGNKQNAQLAAHALGDNNRLLITEYEGNSQDALLDYLDVSYTRYIEAMVSIGLAASTMSFTKFYHTYREVSASGGDFPARMATMFEYLKKDKKSMSVAKHFNAQRPQSIEQCRSLTATLWVCDDVKNNWVFTAN